MKRVDMLRDDWATYCAKNYSEHREKIQSLSRRIRDKRNEAEKAFSRHEYTQAGILKEELAVYEARLKNCMPMDFEAYAKREFSKDFKAIVGGRELTTKQRLFFKIYYNREYLGYKVHHIQKLLNIDHNDYYRVYRAGMEYFFPADSEELSEVG